MFKRSMNYYRNDFDIIMTEPDDSVNILAGHGNMNTERQSLITFDCDKRLSQFKRIPSYFCLSLSFCFNRILCRSCCHFFQKLDGENAISLSLYHSHMIHESLAVYRISNLSIFLIWSNWDVRTTLCLRLRIYCFFSYIFITTHTAWLWIAFAARTRTHAVRERERKAETTVCILYHGKPQKCLLRPNKKEKQKKTRTFELYRLSWL